MTSDSSKRQSSTPKEDYYTILGVPRTATDEEIKRSYRKLALQLHPDKNPDPDATARFQAVSKAYKVLGDPKLRSTYDLLGSQAADMIDQYEDYPGTFSQLSRCKKVAFVLACIFTGCGCCCACCFCICGCWCCCDCCCNHCCGLCKNATVSTEPEEEVTGNNTNDYSHPIHRQPRDTNTNSTRY